MELWSSNRSTRESASRKRNRAGECYVGLDSTFALEPISR